MQGSKNQSRRWKQVELKMKWKLLKQYVGNDLKCVKITDIDEKWVTTDETFFNQWKTTWKQCEMIGKWWKML